MTLILAVMVMMIVVALAVDKPSNMGSLDMYAKTRSCEWFLGRAIGFVAT